MAEPSRVDPHDFAFDMRPTAQSQLRVPELPETASPASNPALNRSAKVVGRRVGSAVAGVRNLPRQFDRLRSRIHIVPGARSSGPGLKDVAVNTAADLRDSAEQTLHEWKEKAEAYTQEIADRTNRQFEDIWQRTEWRVAVLRRDARHWLAQAQDWEAERPLAVVGACAATAFVLGAALRVWRSARD